MTQQRHLSGGYQSSPYKHPSHAVAQGLGWFSIGLGLAELLAPRAMARGLGMEGNERLLMLYGLREIATGIGVLAMRDPAPAVWARVAGDVLDLATLGRYAGQGNARRANVLTAIGAVASVTVVDWGCARALSSEADLPREIPNYRDRVGMPRSPDAMRGIARDAAAVGMNFVRDGGRSPRAPAVDLPAATPSL